MGQFLQIFLPLLQLKVKYVKRPNFLQLTERTAPPLEKGDGGILSEGKPQKYAQAVMNPVAHAATA